MCYNPYTAKNTAKNALKRCNPCLLTMTTPVQIGVSGETLSYEQVYDYDYYFWTQRGSPFFAPINLRNIYPPSQL